MFNEELNNKEIIEYRNSEEQIKYDKRNMHYERSLTLRKNKIKEIINNKRIKNEEIEIVFENKDLAQLDLLSKLINEENNEERLNEIFDKICFFLLKFNNQISFKYIEITKIIPYIYIKFGDFLNKENLVSKIFDVFQLLIRLTKNEVEDNYYKFYDTKNPKLFTRLIDIYIGNQTIISKFLNFLSLVIEKSENLKEYFATDKGFFMTQYLFSLENKCPEELLKLLGAFVPMILNDLSMKNFELLYIKKCELIISKIYTQYPNEPGFILNNLLSFQNLYKCLALLSSSEIQEIIDIFLIKKIGMDNLSLYNKILYYASIDYNLCKSAIEITGNLFCQTEQEYIKRLIEDDSLSFIMDNLLEKKITNNEIKESAAWALSNFVLLSEYRKVFIERKIITHLIDIITKNKNIELTREILLIFNNLFNSLNGNEIVNFSSSNIETCCVSILLNFKEANILILDLKLIDLLLKKTISNNDLIIDTSINGIYFLYKNNFDKQGLFEVLCNMVSYIELQSEICQYCQIIIEKYYINVNFDDF